jgi:hypothetical protein
MDLLNKQLVNKENQFREMSAQLMSHLKKINLLSVEVEELFNGNSELRKKIDQKDDEIALMLKEKLELIDILEALENPEGIKDELVFVEEKEIQKEEEKVEVTQPVEEVEQKEEEKVEELDKEEEDKEETYISDNIDITSELEKLGLVDLVKKY